MSWILLMFMLLEAQNFSWNKFYQLQDEITPPYSTPTYSAPINSTPVNTIPTKIIPTNIKRRK